MIRHCAYQEIDHLRGRALAEGVTLRDGKNYLWWLAKIHNCTIGCAGLIKYKSSYHFIGLYVLAKHRNQGIGNMLRHARVAYASSLGIKKLTANVYHTKWYVNHGWRIKKQFRNGVYRVERTLSHS